MKKWKQWGKSLLRIFCAAAAAVLLGAVLLALSVERLLFRPPEKSRTPGDAENRLMLPAGAETIAVFYLPGPPGANTVLYSHGNAEDLSDIRPLLREFQRRGYGIAGYDYEGYGESTGTPSSEAACRDLEALYLHLTRERKIPPETIIAIGFSVGSGPACFLAEKHPVGGLVLEAPFASAYQVVLPMDGLPGDRFPNARRIKHIRAPVLVIHGEDDRIIPVRNGKKVYSAASEPKTLILVPGAGHNDLKQKLGERYWNLLSEFCRQRKR